MTTNSSTICLAPGRARLRAGLFHHDWWVWLGLELCDADWMLDGKPWDGRLVICSERLHDRIDHCLAGAPRPCV